MSRMTVGIFGRSTCSKVMGIASAQPILRAGDVSNDGGDFGERPVVRRGDGFRKNSTHPTDYADLRTALSTSVLPSDQIAPGTL
jgi:hypothetical protein